MDRCACSVASTSLFSCNTTLAKHALCMTLNLWDMALTAAMLYDPRMSALCLRTTPINLARGISLQVIDCIQPDQDEIVIKKTSSSVFTTTNIDTVLRNLDVKNLILAGALTDQCVESAVRDACDLNYLVTLVTGR